MKDLLYISIIYVSAFIRMFRNHELRFLFWGILYENHVCLWSDILYNIKNFSRKYGLDISFKKGSVGGSFRLIHPWNITVNANTRLGDNVTLFKGCTIGVIEHGKKIGFPCIGSNVTILANATVCGNIKIGNNVDIAAGSFVNFDVHNDSVVVGNSGIIHRKLY